MLLLYAYFATQQLGAVSGFNTRQNHTCLQSHGVHIGLPQEEIEQKSTHTKYKGTHRSLDIYHRVFR